jgi:ectoine hydroxylase-related dioxygenase (phytanoyl-CoA dioxygenase family)
MPARCSKLVLMTDLVEKLQEDGLAVLENVIDSDTVARLCDAVAALNQDAHGLRHLRERCPVVQQLCEDARVLRLAGEAIGPNAFVVRTLFFDKNEKANWKVAWHQDLTIAVKKRIDVPGFGPWSVKDGVVHVQPPVSVLEKMVTVRVHLDDCTLENGPLRVLPGSHRNGRLSPGETERRRQTATEMVGVVRRGGAVVMKPLILHASSAALEAKHRRVIHLEFAAEKLPGGLEWAAS